ncbi:hypothetical protein TURU_007277 [Turdus rufiventris]|nr:hypothetical protein TURU_007277 [Turdus rufiventris]
MNRDAVIPIHKMIRDLESQGVVNKTHSPFNSPIWSVRKSDGEWRLTVDYLASAIRRVGLHTAAFHFRFISPMRQEPSVNKV